MQEEEKLVENTSGRSSLSNRGSIRRSISCPGAIKEKFSYSDYESLFTKIQEKETLNDLVIKMTEPARPPDVEDVKTFLTTYRSFMTTEVLVKMLEKRYQGEGASVPRADCASMGMDELAWKQKVLKPIQIQVCSLLQKLVNQYYDHLDRKSVVLLQLFIRGFVAADDAIMARQLLEPLSNKFIRLNKLRRIVIPPSPQKLPETPKKVAPPPQMPLSPSAYFLTPEAKKSKKDVLSVISPRDLAEKLTKIEFTYFAAVEPTEWLTKSLSMELFHKVK
jgi:hypothetical protein